ncbi:SDR family NAD(P)-dependent oxidoreductase [Arachidicoccus ginsenosidivorans]|uniref:SDR family NAD(P)-dependent oxidoreductase n=2 Tax=Arachidicoccus ginsenosidivorans TaxID=496057 RepID=A0A5B8VTF8_9BACT|nr:SDR family NAD(P)-dependent oxidoreductase [Arachidicoccus ginsenosidivorans]
MEKIWFITGSSRGFGRIWAEAALERGDKVAATARNTASLLPLKEKYGENVLLLTLDVTKTEQVRSAVQAAFDHFGRIDILINNAGYALVGTIEESDTKDIRSLYETNIIGTVSVIQAALPYLRKQGHGHILGVSSGLGHLAYPLIGYYCSSKWAFEAIHESLATEIKPFGLKVTIIEPGAYATEFGSPNSIKQTSTLSEYDPLRMQVMEQLQSLEQGNPNATPPAIFKVVDADEPPLRINLGRHNLPEVSAAYQQRLATWQAWAAVADSVQG